MHHLEVTSPVAGQGDLTRFGMQMDHQQHSILNEVEFKHLWTKHTSIQLFCADTLLKNGNP